MPTIMDPLNILLLAIALVVIWRLKSVLGTRTGNERPPADVTVLRPKTTPRRQAEDLTQEPAQDVEPVSAPWEGLAEEGSPAAKALEAIAKASPDFHGPTFAEGAKRAYEMILSAYAAGDKQALKPLLGRDVAETFFRSIDSRARDGASVVFQFVGVNKVTVERAALEGRTASITLRFRSDMIHALRDKSGETIEGDARAVRDVEDIWTFERDTSSRDPNWRLVATDDDIG